MTEKENNYKIGISIGDYNGIGLEVIIKTFLDNRMLQVCTPVVYASNKLISAYRKAMNNVELSYNVLKPNEAIIPRKLNLVNCWEDELKLELGQATEIAGKFAIKSLDMAFADLQNKKIDAVVTAPINKDMMKKAGFSFAGHTEYFAAKTQAKSHLMFMVSESLKVAVVSGHQPLKDVSAGITQEKILQKLRVFLFYLKIP